MSQRESSGELSPHSLRDQAPQDLREVRVPQEGRSPPERRLSTVKPGHRRLLGTEGRGAPAGGTNSSCSHEVSHLQEESSSLQTLLQMQRHLGG